MAPSSSGMPASPRGHLNSLRCNCPNFFLGTSASWIRLRFLFFLPCSSTTLLYRVASVIVFVLFLFFPSLRVLMASDLLSLPSLSVTSWTLPSCGRSRRGRGRCECIDHSLLSCYGSLSCTLVLRTIATCIALLPSLLALFVLCLFCIE